MAIGWVNALTIDGHDTMRLAEFWGAIFGTSIESVEADGHYVDLFATERSPVLRFQRVPETKTVKNRLHLDVEVDDIGTAVAQAEALGGRVQDVEHQSTPEYGWTFTVMLDPEGNEFCFTHPAGQPDAEVGPDVTK